MTITEIVGPGVFGISFLLTFLILFFLQNQNVFKTLMDPIVPVFFQIFITFFVLFIIGLLNFWDGAAYLLFLILVLFFSKLRIPKIKGLDEEDWKNFLKYFLWLSITMNIYLLLKKGFIYSYPVPALAKVSYYQGYGIFKRINEISVLLFGLLAIYCSFERKPIRAGLLFIYTIYLILSLGNKSGIIVFFFILGAYAHFHQPKFNLFKLILLGAISVFSIIFIYTWIAQEDAYASIYRRLVSFADGPVYYYFGKLQNNLDLPPDYSLDILMTNLKVRPELKYESLGPLINKYYFNQSDPLFGPNPQFIVESKAIFGKAYYAYIIIVTFLAFVVRKLAFNPFSFVILGLFANTIFIDSQLAFSNLLTIGILSVLIFFYLTIKNLSVKRTPILYQKYG